MHEATAVAEQLFAALEAEDWTAAASLFRRDHVEEWFAQLLQNRPSARDARITPEQLMKHSPDMPREVAEYQVAQIRQRFAARSVADELSGVSSWEEAERLDPVEAYGRHLGSRDPRVQHRRATAAVPPALLDGLDWQPVAFRYRVLGSVRETDDLVHVVYRRYWGQDDSSGTLQLLGIRRGEAGWRIELDLQWERALNDTAFVAASYEEEAPDDTA